jgi:hypothetical protein
MPLIHNAEIYFSRLDPLRPNARYDKDNPKWEVQMRTDDFARVQELKEMGIKMKMLVHKEGEHEGEPQLNAAGKKEWRFTFKKGSVKAAKQGGGPAEPPQVVDGDLNPIDPTTIGNGSRANLDIFQYQYGDNKEKTANVLMGVQVTKLVYYKQKPQGFSKAEMEETVFPEEKATDFTEEDEGHDEDQEVAEFTPTSSSLVPPMVASEEKTEDVPF